jgi:thioesterase domain-containing protein
MARQLEKKGHHVATLSLIESYTPAVTLSFEALSSNTLLENKFSDSLFALNVRTMDQYVPKHYHGSVQLFYGSDVSLHPGGLSMVLGGWQDFVTDDVVFTRVPGDHDTVLQRPFVHTLAQHLLEHINEISH